MTIHATDALKGMRAVPGTERIQHFKNLDIYGYTVVPQLLGAGLRDRMLAMVEGAWADISRIRYRGRPDRDTDDRLIYNLQNRDKLFIDLLGHDLLRHVLMEKLNDRYYRFIPADKPNYILSYYNARSSGTALDLHIDSYVPNPGPWCTTMQASFLLENMSEANGCTVVVPGSHRSGEYTDRALENRKPIIGQAGDLVMWDSRLWHGTTGNVTRSSRWALVATFSQWWIKQTMDMTRSLSDAIYQTLSDEQKALLGFCAIPPRDENERINTKTGYESLKPSVLDYRD